MSSLAMVGDNSEKDQITEEDLECCAKELGHFFFLGRGQPQQYVWLRVWISIYMSDTYKHFK